MAIYSTFLQRAFDQILHDVCIEKLSVVFIVDRGGLVGEDGPTHHGQFDLSYLRMLPHMVVMAPKDENELCRMMVTALSHEGPVAIRFPRGAAFGVALDSAPDPVPIGQAEVLTQGRDLLILAIGCMVAEAVQAAVELEQDGIHATVVNCRFVKPLDVELLCQLVQDIPRLLIVEENTVCGGFSSAVIEMLTDHHQMPCIVKRLGLPDQFIEHGKASLLRDKYGLNARNIARVAREMFENAVDIHHRFQIPNLSVSR